MSTVMKHTMNFAEKFDESVISLVQMDPLCYRKPVVSISQAFGLKSSQHTLGLHHTLPCPLESRPLSSQHSGTRHCGGRRFGHGRTGWEAGQARGLRRRENRRADYLTRSVTRRRDGDARRRQRVNGQCRRQ